MSDPLFRPSEPARFEAAIARFDQENARDPNSVLWAGRSQPREWAYAQWLTEWVVRLCPGASEALRLAARSQHLCRWLVPRETYPSNRAGYLRWRGDLKKFHAKKAAEILNQVGYPSGTIARVQALNLKEGFPDDPESRVLEDALCLVFLERQLSDLAKKTIPEKMVVVLRKSWKKMTPAAQSLARQLPYPNEVKPLLEQAFGDP